MVHSQNAMYLGGSGAASRAKKFQARGLRLLKAADRRPPGNAVPSAG